MRWQEQGKTPDYRFSLANERTFLDWIRTALAVLTGGILLHQFVQSLHRRWLVSGLSVLLVLLATFLAAGAYLRWKAVEQAMRNDQPLPWSYLISVLSLGLALLAVAVRPSSDCHDQGCRLAARENHVGLAPHCIGNGSQLHPGAASRNAVRTAGHNLARNRVGRPRSCHTADWRSTAQRAVDLGHGAWAQQILFATSGTILACVAALLVQLADAAMLHG